MAGRMSNRDRIAQKAQEAAATKREKDQQRGLPAGDKPAPRARAAAKKTKAKATPKRIRIVWAVCDHAGKTVCTFAYAQEAEARAEATRLSTATGKTHYATQAEVPFDAD